MSFSSEQNVAAFLGLLNNQPSLFSEDELEELQKDIALLPDDMEQLSKFLSTWYIQRPKIRDAQFKNLKPENSEDRLIPKNGSYVKPKNNSDLNKTTLQNSIKRASDSISDIQKSADKQ